MTILCEIWRDVDGFAGMYQVSNMGGVKSLVRGQRILEPSTQSEGYKSVTLYKNGIRTQQLVHRLVASAFLPNPENKDMVNHKNGVRSDNRIENLEWNTRSENERHKQYVLRKDTQKHKRPVFCMDTCTKYDSVCDAERETGANKQNISACCLGRRKHAGGLRWRYAEVGT